MLKKFLILVLKKFLIRNTNNSVAVLWTDPKQPLLSRNWIKHYFICLSGKLDRSSRESEICNGLFYRARQSLHYLVTAQGHFHCLKSSVFFNLLDNHRSTNKELFKYPSTYPTHNIKFEAQRQTWTNKMRTWRDKT